MESTKSIKLQLIQEVLACQDPAVLQTALQLLRMNRPSGQSKSHESDRALHEALLGVRTESANPGTQAPWNEEAIADLQRSIDEVFGKD